MVSHLLVKQCVLLDSCCNQAVYSDVCMIAVYKGCWHYVCPSAYVVWVLGCCTPVHAMHIKDQSLAGQFNHVGIKAVAILFVSLLVVLLFVLLLLSPLTSRTHTHRQH